MLLFSLFVNAPSWAYSHVCHKCLVTVVFIIYSDIWRANTHCLFHVMMYIYHRRLFFAYVNISTNEGWVRKGNTAYYYCSSNADHPEWGCFIEDSGTLLFLQQYLKCFLVVVVTLIQLISLTLMMICRMRFIIQLSLEVCK